jgi:hypothetical protein
MRSLVVALTAIAFLTGPALAQRGGRGYSTGTEQPKKEEKRVDEKDYKSALDRIPAADQKPDPWRTVRKAPKPK